MYSLAKQIGEINIKSNPQPITRFSYGLFLLEHSEKLVLHTGSTPL
jgi:hypothetical protein